MLIQQEAFKAHDELISLSHMTPPLFQIQKLALHLGIGGQCGRASALLRPLKACLNMIAKLLSHCRYLSPPNRVRWLFIWARQGAALIKLAHYRCVICLL